MFTAKGFKSAKIFLTTLWYRLILYYYLPTFQAVSSASRFILSFYRSQVKSYRISLGSVRKLSCAKATNVLRGKANFIFRILVEEESRSDSREITL